jgi:hypothetical protein
MIVLVVAGRASNVKKEDEERKEREKDEGVSHFVLQVIRTGYQTASRRYALMHRVAKK